MTVAHAEAAKRLRDDAGLSDVLIARANRAAASTVRGWLAGRSAPTGRRAERLGELLTIADRLPRVMRAEYIPAWLTRPIEALEDDKPVDLIARGEYRRVAKVISSLEDAGAV